MAEYPAISFADISAFSGRPLEDYPVVYSTTAIAQATLLFKIATCLTQIPDDAVSQELAKTAIIALAESLILAQPYAVTMASPFSSETIGSYSYSKMAARVSSAEATGVPWFDLAVLQLGVCGENDSAFSYGGIEIMEHDATYTQGSGGEGNLRLVSDEEGFQGIIGPSEGPYDVF